MVSHGSRLLGARKMENEFPSGKVLLLLEKWKNPRDETKPRIEEKTLSFFFDSR